MCQCHQLMWYEVLFAAGGYQGDGEETGEWMLMPIRNLSCCISSQAVSQLFSQTIVLYYIQIHNGFKSEL